MEKVNKLNCIELFAGAGGMGTGFIKEGFNIIVANDILEDCAKTYVINHPNTKYIVKDISQITSKDLLANTKYTKNDIDIIIGGPPCQGFSTLGKRFIDDPRNRLFKEYVRIVEDINPKIFVMENVVGILTMEQGKVLENILSSFYKIGYKVEYKILNSAEYGVPQIRERVIFIGTRLNIDINFPKKTHSFIKNDETHTVITLAEAIGDLPINDIEEIKEYKTKPQNEYQSMIRNNNKTITNHKPSIHSEKATKMMKYIPEGKSVWEVNLPEELRPTSGYGNTYARLDSKIPGMTITRNFSCISSSRCIHPFANRGLTIREAARIQSFPDTYIFKGAKTSMQLQIGNAVPPVLAQNIAKKIKEML